VIELESNITSGARICVVGVGGGGGNAINSMIAKGLSGVEFIAANTDVQALHNNLAPIKVQLGKMSTRGLGAGADPAVGYKAVEESAEEIKQALAGADMVFVTAGMGGGTGTGAAPFVAKIARELGALVVGIVTKPFKWEAAKRAAVAERGTEELRRHVDALIVIPNQRLMSVIDKHTSFKEAFQKVDEVLSNATRGISDIISGTGYINVDFADVRTIMKNTGDALMGTGIAKGEHRAVEAAQAAISSPLLDGVSIQGAQGVLVNVTGSSDMTMFEIGDAVSIIEQAAGSDVNLIHGIVFDDSMGDAVMVTVVATGFGKSASQASTSTHTASTSVASPQPEAKPQQTVVESNVSGSHLHTTPPPSTVTPINHHAPTTTVATKRPLPASSPSGLQELQKYDEPAFQRRLGISSIKINKFDADTTEELPKDEQLTKPAFLRRIMD
jgi:cell division protein FtsZ